MIGPLLRVAASAAAARSLRNAAHDAAMRALLTLGAAVAVGIGFICLTCSAYILLARSLDPAAAWGILGVFWGVAGLLYFAVASRRRG
jgi:predicted cobalt transporter CbtA